MHYSCEFRFYRTFARYISRQTHTGPKFLHIQISNSIHTYLEEKERYRMIYHLYINSKLEFPPRIPMFEHEKILNLKFGSQLDTKRDHWLFLGTKDWKTCAKCWIIYSRLNLSILSCLHYIHSNRLISDCSHYI